MSREGIGRPRQPIWSLIRLCLDEPEVMLRKERVVAAEINQESRQ